MENKKKTYKREVAIVMFVFLAALTVWGVYDPEAKDASRFFALPIFGFGGAAFALDWRTKQGGGFNA